MIIILGGERGHLGWAPEGWGPEGWGPKISRFFFPAPAHSSLSWGSSRGILVVFLKAGALKCARSGSRTVVWNPGGFRGRRGFTRQPENSKRAHQNCRRRPPREGRMNENGSKRGKKKNEILGGPVEGGPGGGRSWGRASHPSLPQFLKL